MTETAKTTTSTTAQTAKAAPQPEKTAARAPQPEAAKEGNVDTVEATIIKVGKQRKRRIRQLKRGEGRLAQKIDLTLGQVTSMLAQELEGKKIIPVVIICRKKSGGGRRFGLF